VLNRSSDEDKQSEDASLSYKIRFSEALQSEERNLKPELQKQKLISNHTSIGPMQILQPIKAQNKLQKEGIRREPAVMAFFIASKSFKLDVTSISTLSKSPSSWSLISLARFILLTCKSNSEIYLQLHYTES